MREEKFSIKCPEHIIIGDPWYFETETGERLKKLVVDYKPDKSFSARLNIEETEEDGMYSTNIFLCFAPEEHIELYMAEYRYQTQKMDRKPLYVDTAKYQIKVDGREAEYCTMMDGTWGGETTIYHEDAHGKKIIDGVAVYLYMPFDMTFERTKHQMSMLFEDMERLPERNRNTQAKKQSSKKEPKR